MHRYFKARIAENVPLNNDFNLLTLIPLVPVQESRPGQFFMIGTEGDYDPLLKRPFSIFRNVADGFQILYRIRGRGTMLLRNMREGAVIDVLGPLGNPYPLPEDDQTPVVVTGGIGMASLFSLAERLAPRSCIFYGARNADELLMVDELTKLARELFITTDDGSQGHKGTVVQALDRFLRERPPETLHPVIYSCGPVQMLKALWRLVRESGAKVYVSMEENMACGIGACLGCVVRTQDGHKTVCKDGPVFDIEQIVWE